MSTNQLQAEARALRETAQQCLTKAEALEASLATTPTPRPYYYGQEIRGINHPNLKQRALGELGRRAFLLYLQGYTDVWTPYSAPKCDFTHLDGTPLGEFRVVPTEAANKNWPDSAQWVLGGLVDCASVSNIRERINHSLLAWRDSL